MEKDQSEWCVKQLNILNKKSPTSMGVTTRQLNLAKELSLKKCLSMEFRICQAMMQRHDFYEGVRANLVDKDRKPKWNPKNVYELSNDAIEEHFKNLGERELLKMNNIYFIGLGNMGSQGVKPNKKIIYRYLILIVNFIEHSNKNVKII